MRAHPRLSRDQVFSAEHVPLGLKRHVLHGTHAAHSHDFVEVAVVLGGSGVHHTARGEQAVSAGHTFVLRPGSWHAYAGCRQLEVYNCCFGTELLRGDLAWLLEDPLAGRLFGTGPLPTASVGIVPLWLPPATLDTCRQHMDTLQSATEATTQGSRLEQIGHLMLLLDVLARCAAPEMMTANPRQAHLAVVTVTRMLNAQIDRDWTLPAIAHEVCLDPSYLVRLCKVETGLSPVAYLARQRLERAAYLLLSTSKRVSDVGAAVGWADPNYFARRFRAHYGASPSAYRARFHAGGTADTG